MLESIFIIILILAILLLIATIEWESITIGVLDSGIWFLLAVAITRIEIPYEYVNNGQIIEATHTITNLAPFGYLFMGIGIIVIIYVIFHILEMMYKRKYETF